MRIPLAAAAITAALSLSACAYGGYPGVSMGYGNYGGYNNGYYDPYYGGYSPYGYQSAGYGGYGGYGYGSPFGWYDGFYYPGTGYYVYDNYRRPHVWSDRQRQYWVRLKPQSTSGAVTTTASVNPNWSGFSRRQPVTGPARVERNTTRTSDRQARVESRVQSRDAREEARIRRRHAQ